MNIHIPRKGAQEQMHCVVVDGLDYNHSPVKDPQKVQQILDQVGFSNHVIGSDIRNCDHCIVH